MENWGPAVLVIVGLATALLYNFWKRKTAFLTYMYKTWMNSDILGSGGKKFLRDPEVKYLITLVEKEIISHDTRRFRFALESQNHVLGLPIGQHIHVSANIGGENVVRSYTPVSSDNDYGYVDLIIKVYFKNVHPKFPEGGKMSQHLESMKIGDTINVRGPSGRLIYLGKGKFVQNKLKAEKIYYTPETVSMIAGGTGITPMLQLIRHIMKEPGNTVKIALLYANQKEDDILCRKELEEVLAEYPEKFKLWYTLDSPPEGWKYSQGFISADMIEKNLYKPSEKSFVVMCGPPPMIKFACKPNLETLGYNMNLCYSY